jgi:hypothetical protein
MHTDTDSYRHTNKHTTHTNTLTCIQIQTHTGIQKNTSHTQTHSHAYRYRPIQAYKQTHHTHKHTHMHTKLNSQVSELAMRTALAGKTNLPITEAHNSSSLGNLLEGERGGTVFAGSFPRGSRIWQNEKSVPQRHTRSPPDPHGGMTRRCQGDEREQQGQWQGPVDVPPTPQHNSAFDSTMQNSSFDATTHTKHMALQHALSTLAGPVKDAPRLHNKVCGGVLCCVVDAACVCVLLLIGVSVCAVCCC